MPSLLPISDLSWIAIFQEFTPNDQMVASKMSPQCAVLVRAANRNEKSLVITGLNPENPDDLKNLKDQINRFSFASNPAMQQLMDIPGEPSFSDYPMTTTRLSKWHCLVIDLKRPIDTATAEQVVNIFSAVTDLKFITYNNGRLLPLLQHPNWQCQLTNLMVDMIGNQKGCELIAAINGLTALQYLALHWYGDTDFPNLTILAQLKVVALNAYYLQIFLPSLEQYATDNADLQVHLLSRDTANLLSLSQPLHSRIVRYRTSYLGSTNGQVPLCSQFRSLTSLSIYWVHSTEAGPLFTALSQLHQLVHLQLEVNLTRGELPSAQRPLAELNSVRALELHLNISSHSQVQWLNLPVTMPNLQAICIEGFYCSGCKVHLNRYINGYSSLLKSSKALNCFQSSLFTLHPGVLLNRLILDLKEGCISAEKLLLQSTSEPPVTTGQP